LMIDFWTRVKSLLGDSLTLKWLAEESAMPYGTLMNSISKDRLPAIDVGCKLAEVLGVSVEYLVTGKDPYEEEAPDEDEQDAVVKSSELIKHEIITPSGRTITYKNDEIVMVPILAQRVSAGCGEDWETAPLETGHNLPVLKKLIRIYPEKSLRVIEVRGDSMTGVNLFDGDMAIFVNNHVHGDGIYVIAIHNELYVKRLEFDPIDKTIRVISENERYKDKLVKADTDIVQICGKVVGWVHSHPY